MSDAMVLATQNWLNENYSNVNGFDPVPTNGKTGWSTVYGLTKALQHELGITTLVDSFGPSTAQKYKEFGELSPGFIGQSRKEIAIITILQGAMYCKGYDPGAFRDGVFSNYMGQSVAKLQNDAGLSVQDGKVYDYIFKAFLTMDAYKLTLNGDPGTRTIQQELNRKYYKTSGVQPCDGHYQRGTNRALIYGIQTEIGIAPSSQTGAIGPATKAGLPTLKVGQTSPFVKLFQFALHFNGFKNTSFTDYFNSALQSKTEEFQRFSMLTINGQADKQTWLSSLVSTGDADRRGTACDCVTMITPKKAQALKLAGYETVGRYLTNASASGLNKKIQPGELKNIFEAGLTVFPIYQTLGSSLSYFNYEQGKKDAGAAYSAAKEYGFKKGTTIYFSVDFDALGEDIVGSIIPHFQAIKEVFDSQGIYNVGVYGARNVCIQVSEAGYAKYSFVSGMSAGFSGNLGFPLPSNWAFDQISTISVGSGEGYIQIDNNIKSGRDHGQNSVDIIVTANQLEQIGWYSEYLTPSMLKSLNDTLQTYDITSKLRVCHFISQASVESLYGYYTEEEDPGVRYEGREDLGNIYPGDGPKYKGAGYIQMTGRYNYTKLAEEVNDPKVLSEGSSYVAENYPWIASGFWWELNNMNDLCDTNPTVRTVSIRVNGTITEETHLPERESAYAIAIQVF